MANISERIICPILITKTQFNVCIRINSSGTKRSNQCEYMKHSHMSAADDRGWNKWHGHGFIICNSLKVLKA